MRADVVGLLLSTLLLARPASAYDPYDLASCNGIGWDDKRILVVAKVTAKPHVNFIKSPYDDDFKAEGCPAATGACQNKSYLGGAHRPRAGGVHLRLLSFAAVE
jgi:hypothetical protein